MGQNKPVRTNQQVRSQDRANERAGQNKPSIAIESSRVAELADSKQDSTASLGSGPAGENHRKEGGRRCEFPPISLPTGDRLIIRAEVQFARKPKNIA